ncbi:MAG TPA: 3-carboxy-cis,cis-muconate cycloisomerase [Terracidiphilus sp.]|nr:3-carboxy-cis,cis-muconate cycloisomerase [Terracidiphilus sp.]
MTTEPTSPFFSTPEMDRIFSLSVQLRRMTRFEWALTFALESAGLAGEGAAAVMEPLVDCDFVDVPLLLNEARQAGNLAIPFVRQLTAKVRQRNEAAAALIHLGATSQDVLDTALVLQSREALTLILSRLDELETLLVDRARAHAGTAMAARTWLQDGPPTTFGLKIAGWIAALRRHRQRLRAAGERAIVLEFGGAVGTLAALGEKGAEVSAALARTLDLREPELPWHTHRDNLVEMAAALGMLVGTLGKMARDFALLMQTEIGEVSEPAGEGRGRSSTMPHKNNPIACAAIVAAAMRAPALVATLLSAMMQEHERGLGNWQAEWETYPEVFRLADAALDRSIEIARGMRVFPERMAANLEATGGLAMAEAVSVALAVRIGGQRAHELIRSASQRTHAEGRSLREILIAMPEVREHFSQAEIDRLLDPRNYLGSSQRFVERVVGGFNGAR